MNRATAAIFALATLFLSACALGPSRLKATSLEYNKAVRKTRKVVEDADDVGHLETSLVVEAEVAQRLPVLLNHLRRLGRELARDRAEGSISIR